MDDLVPLPQGGEHPHVQFFGRWRNVTGVDGSLMKQASWAGSYFVVYLAGGATLAIQGGKGAKRSRFFREADSVAMLHWTITRLRPDGHEAVEDVLCETPEEERVDQAIVLVDQKNQVIVEGDTFKVEVILTSWEYTFQLEKIFVNAVRTCVFGLNTYADG